MKSTETKSKFFDAKGEFIFSNFGSLKSTETRYSFPSSPIVSKNFSNFGSLKSTETHLGCAGDGDPVTFQQFRLVEEH